MQAGQTQTALIVLAAGQGSRMNSDLPKVLHKIGGAPLLMHALRAGENLEPSRVVVVTGHGAEAVEAVIGEHDASIVCVRQEARNGTAHAVDQARPALADFDGTAVVLYGDTPFVRPETLMEMVETHRGGGDLVVLGFEAQDPGRYGRLITGEDGLERIIEAKDATDEERAIRLCNSGIMTCAAPTLFELISEVGNDNASGEYYLTDIVGLARARGLKASVVTCAEAETLGINTRRELSQAEQIFQSNARGAALDTGVTMADPRSVFFAFDTEIGRDASVGPNVVFGPGVTVESGAEIHAFCHLEGCHVACGASVGPFARLRPGTEMYENSKVGNFVEVKNAILDEGAKVNHLTYVGDSEIGRGANVGAGTVTCNYDGVFKHKTKIGEKAFIGSGTMLVAPVTVGAEAMTASGSVITEDVPDGALGLGRARQTNKLGLAAKLMEMLRSRKAKLTK